MLRPLPPTHWRRSPSVSQRSISSASTCRRSIGRALSQAAVARWISASALTPARDRVGIVEEAGTDDLVPILLDRESPASAAMAAVPQRPIVQCNSPAASFSCCHRDKRHERPPASPHPSVAGRRPSSPADSRCRRCKPDGRSFSMPRRTSRGSGRAGHRLPARRTSRSILKRSSCVRLVSPPDHVAAGAPDGLANLGEQRLRLLCSDDAHRVARLDPRAVAQREVDQQAGVALDYLLIWFVAHRASYKRHRCGCHRPAYASTSSSWNCPPA